MIDYEVASLTSRRESPVAGLVDTAGGKTRLIAPKADSGGAEHGSVHSLRRDQAAGHHCVPGGDPAALRGGRAERVTWDGQGTWKEMTRRGPHQLLSVEIDPERRITLEVSRLNSARRVVPSARVAAAWSARWMFWVQNLLAGVGL